jgi:hypothetical protein
LVCLQDYAAPIVSSLAKVGKIGCPQPGVQNLHRKAYIESSEKHKTTPLVVCEVKARIAHYLFIQQ